MIEEFVNRGYYASHGCCNSILSRGIDKGILEENNGNISVREPTCFVLKVLRGGFLDNWKALTIPSCILTMIFCYMNPALASVFALVTLGLVVGWFVEDYLSILKL
ncbi:MAG: hypothetical protein NWF06_10330 [Candidatus Bathyarchaeota archaeon]|nr:hypothetical protein [Candidatus Bathyarchaeum sp.]